MDNITELNVLIYIGVKLACDKTGVPLRNSNRNGKPGGEIWLEGQVKKLWQVKMLRKEKRTRICWDEKIKTAEKSDCATWRDQLIKRYWWKKENVKDTKTGSSNTVKTGLSKNNKRKFYQQVGKKMHNDIPTTECDGNKTILE